jgi:hypothetical protein
MRTLWGRQIAALFLTVSVASFAIPLTAVAQQSGDAPPPPQLQKLEEGEAPEVNIRTPNQQRKITEQRANGGKVNEVKVTKGKNTYVLKSNDQAGGAVPGDGQASEMRAAQWPVLEFDWGRRDVEKEKQAAEEAAAAKLPPAPPPPAKK